MSTSLFPRRRSAAAAMRLLFAVAALAAATMPVAPTRADVVYVYPVFSGNVLSLPGTEPRLYAEGGSVCVYGPQGPSGQAGGERSVTGFAEFAIPGAAFSAGATVTLELANSNSYYAPDATTILSWYPGTGTITTSNLSQGASQFASVTQDVPEPVNYDVYEYRFDVTPDVLGFSAQYDTNDTYFGVRFDPTARSQNTFMAERLAIESTPEPTAFALLGAGASSLAAYASRRKRRT